MEKVNHPQHYNKNGIECFDVIKAFFGNHAFEQFCLCNALKYIVRCKHKGNYVQDLEKARFYLDQVLEINKEEKIEDDALKRLHELAKRNSKEYDFTPIPKFDEQNLTID